MCGWRSRLRDVEEGLKMIQAARKFEAACAGRHHAAFRGFSARRAKSSKRRTGRHHLLRTFQADATKKEGGATRRTAIRPRTLD